MPVSRQPSDRRTNGAPVLATPVDLPVRPPGSVEDLRQKLHDGLCQQLAGSALLQAALVNRLEQLGRGMTAATDDSSYRREMDSALQEILAEARQVGDLLHAALVETRTIMQEPD